MEEKEIKKWLVFYRTLVGVGLAFILIGLIGHIATGELICIVAMVGGLALANTGLIGHLELAIEEIYEILRGEDNGST